jgi:hypothetical protein
VARGGLVCGEPGAAGVRCGWPLACVLDVLGGWVVCGVGEIRRC